jgi:RNA polymerase sigma-70 factor (ECF subfamily)
MLEDRLLLLRFKRGSRDALQRIYVKYRTFLLKMAVGLLRDPAAAEDVVHDVFLRLAHRPDKISANGNLKAFLRICVLNEARRQYRREKVRSCVAVGHGAPVGEDEREPSQLMILSEEALRVVNALGSIPPEQREAIVLHLHGEMSFRQISELCDVPLATIQSRYRYGISKLRSILDEEVHP